METEEHHRIAVDYGNYENILNYEKVKFYVKV